MKRMQSGAVVTLILLTAIPQQARAGITLPTQITDVLRFGTRNLEYFQSLGSIQGLSEALFGSIDLNDMSNELIQNLADMGFKAIGFDPSKFVDDLQGSINEVKAAIAAERNKIYRLLTFSKSALDSDIGVSPELDSWKYNALAEKGAALGQQEQQVEIGKNQMEFSNRLQNNMEEQQDNTEKILGQYDDTGVQLSAGMSQNYAEAAMNATSTREVTQVLVGVASEQLNQQALNAASTMQMLAEIAKQQSITNQQLSSMVGDQIKTNIANANKMLSKVQEMRGQAQSQGRDVYNKFMMLRKTINGIATPPKDPGAL